MAGTVNQDKIGNGRERNIRGDINGLAAAGAEIIINGIEAGIIVGLNNSPGESIRGGFIATEIRYGKRRK